jgi:germination protein M
MRKCLCLFLLVSFLLTGCTLPLEKDARGTAGEETTKDGTKSGTKNTGEGTEEMEPLNLGMADIPEDQKMTITLYYQDGDGYLIPVSRSIKKQEGIAKTAVQAIIDSPINREELQYYSIYPVLPQGTEVRGLNIRDRRATIDLNGSVLSYEDEISERNIVASIVYTLTEFSTVGSVRILVDGMQQTDLKYGTDISGELDRKNVLINAGKVNLSEGAGKADIFFSRSIGDKYTYLLPVSIEDTKLQEEQLAERIITELSAKQASKQFFTAFPEGVKLLDNHQDEDQLTLDLSTEVKNYGGNAREDILVKQLLFSMKQIQGVRKVKILVAGDELGLPEGTDTTEPLLVPAVINNVFDEQ